VTATLDASFDAKIEAGQNYVVHALKIQPNGKILVGDRFSSIDGRAKASLARLNPDARTAAFVKLTTTTGKTSRACTRMAAWTAPSSR